MSTERLTTYKNLSLVTFVLILLLGVFSLSAYAQQSFDEFLEDDAQAYTDFENRQRQEFEEYVRQVRQKWDEFQNSTRKDWCDYSDDLNTLSKVDFDAGEVTIETVVESDNPAIMDQARENITKQVQKLFDIDSISAEKVLDNQVAFESGDPVNNTNLDKYVKDEIIPKIVIEKEPIKSQDGVERVKLKTSFKLVPDHLRVRAEKFLPIVKKYCEKYNLDVPLILAMMQTESYFNPRAKSPAPAYGLMQLVPKSGGREAYKYAFRQDKIVRPNYLYVPENNIHLGCAYLAKLRDTEFKKVKDSDNRRYCLIASYNTGPGNLSRAIQGSRDIYSAVDKINSMKSDRLFEKLKRDLPYAETRDYIVKVETRRENYLEWQ